jgi:hypothetical protein
MNLPLWQRVLWVASLLLVLAVALALLGGYGAEWGLGAAP